MVTSESTLFQIMKLYLEEMHCLLLIFLARYIAPIFSETWRRPIFWQIIKQLFCLMPLFLLGGKISLLTLMLAPHRTPTTSFLFFLTKVISCHFHSPFLEPGTSVYSFSHLVLQRLPYCPLISRKFYNSKPFLFLTWSIFFGKLFLSA